MKKQGDNWKKYENLDKEILNILDKENKKTISQIKDELETDASWVTIKNYLASLYRLKKVEKVVLGKYTYWSKR